MEGTGGSGLKDRRVRSACPAFAESDIARILKDIRRILSTGRLILGPYLQRFEEEFASYVGVKHAAGLSSCTAALEATLRYLKVAGGEVVVPTNTFVASANAVIYAGATPVFCDIDKTSLALDVQDLERRLTRKTRAVIVVHIAGTISPAIWDIKRLCDSKRIPLVEDAAHAHGAMIDGCKAGALGMAGCFSMYPTKVMTTAGGGMVTTNDPGLARFCSAVRHHGAGAEGLSVPECQGNDWIMDEMSAAVGRRQLARLDRFLASRNQRATLYREQIEHVPGLSNLPISSNRRNSHYKYIVLLDNKRVNVQRILTTASSVHNVELAQLYFPPCHLQPIFRSRRRVRLPNAEDVLPRAIALPMHPKLSRKDVTRVVGVLQTLCPGAGRT